MNGVLNSKQTPLAHFVLAIALGFFILGTRINVFGTAINSSVMGLIGLFILQLIRFDSKYFARYRKIIPYVTTCVVLATYSAATQYYFHGTSYNFYFSRICINYSIYLLAGVAAVNIMNSLNLDYIWFFLLVFYISVLNSIIIVLEFNFPEFRVALESILYQSPDSNIDYQSVQWRLRGLAAAGGASLSIFTVAGIVAGAIAVHLRGLSIFAFMACSFIMLISLITIARTGLYLGGLILIIFALNQMTFNFLVTWRPLLTSLLIPILYFIIAAPNYTAVLPWTLELWVNLFTRGDLSTASTNDLISMYSADNSAAMQISAWQWIWGIGFFDGGTNYRNDSGYMKTLYSVGILGAITIYGLFAYHLFEISKRLSRAAYIWLAFVVFLFFAELKEPFLYQNYTGRTLALLLVFGCLARTLSRDRHP